jgi:DNA mismatch repair ATPase MutS
VRLRELRAAFDESLAPGGLASLHRRIPFVYLGLAGVLHTIIDVVCLWDLQVLLLIERCSLRERGRLLQAVSAVGELEMLCSLAAFSAEQPCTSWPQLVSGPPRLTIREGRHPLVGHERAVANTAVLGEGENTWLITGSNMSGKSTFLRMLGANVLLARAGSAVCAVDMTLTPLRILTDLRIRDDLARQESYFLAEVRQVRRMVVDARAGAPILALIDEPFRGTNSAERVAAAGAVIGSLIRGSGLHLIATHDAALATIAAREGGTNYHFEERFEQSQMVFDYRIRPGPARGRNALRVLESENYPGDVIARARELAAELGDKSPASEG